MDQRGMLNRQWASTASLQSTSYCLGDHRIPHRKEQDKNSEHGCFCTKAVLSPLSKEIRKQKEIKGWWLESTRSNWHYLQGTRCPQRKSKRFYKQPSKKLRHKLNYHKGHFQRDIPWMVAKNRHQGINLIFKKSKTFSEKYSMRKTP